MNLDLRKGQVIFMKSEDLKRKVKGAIAALGLATYQIMCYGNAVVYAADKKTNSTTDTGVKDVTDGIGVIKDLVLGCVGGVGVIFLAWGLLDFGTAYAAHDTTQQGQAIKKVVGGLIMVAVPSILALLGV